MIRSDLPRASRIVAGGAAFAAALALNCAGLSAARADSAPSGRLLVGQRFNSVRPVRSPRSAPPPRRRVGSTASTAMRSLSRPDPYYPLAEATNEPPPRTPGGPPLWLGGQKRRGIALAAAVADGWLLPAVVALGSPSDLDYFSVKRDAILAALAAIGRDPAGFQIAAQVPTGTTAEDRAWALGQARDAVSRGATTVILGMPPALGAAGVDAVAADIAIPLREVSADARADPAGGRRRRDPRGVVRRRPRDPRRVGECHHARTIRHP